MFALVRQLRDSDAHGAPLLFQASSHSSNVECFKAACQMLESTVGVGGLMEQLRAVDRKGKSLQMRAAASGSFTVFHAVEELMKMMGNQTFIKRTRDQKYREEEKYDNMRRTLLHHAAAGGCAQTLKSVSEVVKRSSIDWCATLCEEDRQGVTPVMLLLGKSYPGGDQTGILQTMLYQLLHPVTCQTQLELLQCPKSKFQLTPVICASRGGWNNLMLTLAAAAAAEEKKKLDSPREELIRILLDRFAPVQDEADEQISQDEREIRAVGKALCLDKREKSYVYQLVAQSALGGHSKVLEGVMRASGAGLPVNW